MTIERCPPHYWLVEGHGYKCKGVCKYCGEEREFYNYIDYDLRRDFATENRAARNNSPGVKAFVAPAKRDTK